MAKSFTFWKHDNKPMLSVIETVDETEIRNETYGFSYYYGPHGDGTSGQYLIPDNPGTIPADVEGYLVSLSRKKHFNFRPAPAPKMRPVE
jgi:hypothetical protein